jgi:prephenate dehydratase
MNTTVQIPQILDVALVPGEAMSIATLGPAGTSSEASARHLLHWVAQALNGRVGPIQLFATYEDAREMVLAGNATHLLVANAYREINNFYMDPKLKIAAAYRFNTPNYGLAKRRGAQISSRVCIASHPSPTPLIEELLPAEVTVSAVITMLSTSAAAAAVDGKEIDLALTTDVAAQIYDLEFISRTRPIEMLWTAFRPTWDSVEPPGGFARAAKDIQ